MIRTTTMERSNTHPITDEQQTIKAGSIDWNAVITSLQQTINNLHITRGYRDDRISELEDRVELLEKKLLEVGIKVDDDAHLVDDEEEEPFDIEYDCPKCGINRGKHDVSKHNRLIPCESDGEDDEEEDEEQEVKCVCEFCFGEGVCYVSKQRATELKEKGLMEQSCPFGDKCSYEVKKAKKMKIKIKKALRFLNSQSV